MLFRTTVARFFHTGGVILATDKSQLSALRKKTGYTFANCKKALELHDNNLTQAEVWLKEQAQALGWSKATKLEGRQTTQGLIGVAVKNQDGVLIEVNCETDFVARNQEFQKIVEEVASTCLNFTRNHQKSSDGVTKICLDKEQLRNLQADDGKTLADKLALMIGAVGENATLTRALCFKAGNDIQLTGYAHPSGNAKNDVLMGRVGSIIAFKSTQPVDNMEEISKGICQHIVGMDPKKVGTVDDEPANSQEEEICLIHQEYILDDTIHVREVLEEHKLEIFDFKRFECGETIGTIGDQPLEFVETCQ